MNFSKNYYAALQVSNTATDKELKKAYYSLSKKYHPDLNKDDNAEDIFKEICDAYKILSSDLKEQYDKRSRWGKEYDESLELLDYEFSNVSKGWDEEKLEAWKKKNQLNILIYVDNTFNGTINYERWVICKDCGGDGRDTSSKIIIRDEKGNVKMTFEGNDGCDFCEGSGKDWKGNNCYFCGGKGKVGFTECKTCKGNKRILGKQRIKKIVFPENEKAYKLPNKGHYSKEEAGKIGHIWLIKKEEK